MSRFKYEINERSLKMQLKGHTLQFHEEAWTKFEIFSAAQKSAVQENVFSRFQISINRNVVLPLVFGAVIVLFSLLLFNFVNIKNPGFETAVVKEQSVRTSPVQTQEKPSIMPPKLLAQPAIEEVTNVDEQTKAIESQPKTFKNDITASVSNPISQNKSEVNTKKESQYNFSNAKTEANAAPIVPAIKMQAQRKKRLSRQPIVAEPSEDEEIQVPPSNSENSLSSAAEIQ